MATWQPQEQGLLELLQLCRESQSTEQEVQLRIADVSSGHGGRGRHQNDVTSALAADSS